MITSIFEVYGAICFLSLIAFFFWAGAAKLRPDLDEDKFHVGELEAFAKVASTKPFVPARPVGGLTIEHAFRSAPPRSVKRGKRLVHRHRRPHLIHARKPRRPTQAA